MAERRNRDDYKSSSDTSDSDEEWTPSMNRKKSKGNKNSITVYIEFSSDSLEQTLYGIWKSGNATHLVRYTTGREFDQGLLYSPSDET